MRLSNRQFTQVPPANCRLVPGAWVRTDAPTKMLVDGHVRPQTAIGHPADPKNHAEGPATTENRSENGKAAKALLECNAPAVIVVASYIGLNRRAPECCSAPVL
jgi:hypothetical protein